MYTTTTKMRLRKEFMEEHPEKKVLAGNATDFKSDYVEWLERQLNDLRIANVSVAKRTLPDDSHVIGWIKDDFENQVETFVRNPNFKGNAL